MTLDDNAFCLQSRILKAVNLSSKGEAIGLAEHPDRRPQLHDYKAMAERQKISPHRIGVVQWIVERLHGNFWLDEIERWPPSLVPMLELLSWVPKDPKHPLVLLAEQAD